jgi:gas vesicle structural protein
MAVERVSGGSSLIDVLDRVLDKGIVVDAWVRISMVGIDLLTAGTRVEVASIETCLHYADDADRAGLASRAALGEAGKDGVRVLGEVRPHAPRRRR